MKAFRYSPATFVIEHYPHDIVQTGETISYGIGSVEGFEAPVVIEVRGMNDARYTGATELVENVDGTWTGLTWPNNNRFTIRLAIEDDAVSAISLDAVPNVPMPIPVIAALVGNTVSTMPTLWAMYEDDGFVATMMLSADTGIYVRYSGAWHLLTDEDVVDGLSVAEAEDAALDMFDQFDRAGQMVHVSAMPTKQTTGESVIADTTPVAASAVLTRDVPELAGPDDLPDAIEAATENPELRWWVERRVKALGIETEFPWGTGA